ncbi:MAG: hypothetical protein IKY02_03705 [Lachnospiraceae bacterium]|nr:hypothetical protein [Lachnospiraceae bacterium]
MIISFILLAALAFAFLKRDRGEEPALKKLGKKRKVPVRIGSTGLMISRVGKALVRRIRKTDDIEKPRLLFSEEDRKAETANVFGGIYLLLFLGAAAGLAVGIAGLGGNEVTEVKRPEFGETRTVNLLASREGTEEDVEVEVAGREPKEAEMDAVFEEAYQAASGRWLNGNASFSAVQTNLRFEKEDEKGITYRFQSEDPEKLTDYGTILAEDIPESGEPVSVEVTLSYGLYEKTFLLEVVLLPAAETAEKTAIQAAIEAAEASGRGEETLKLPSEIDGAGVSFSKKTLSPYTVVGIAVLIAFVLAFLPQSREKAEFKRRDEELAFSYAQAVTGLTAYIGAGMSIRMAWQRIAENYRAAVAGKKRKREYVYEEMLLSANEMAGGVSEEEAYVRFGRRLGQHRYLKLGNLLSQNLRQGISGMEKALEAESREALEERRQLALKKGEEAGTKLLAPMMIMLGIVLLVLVVPAFMMF